MSKSVILNLENLLEKSKMEKHNHWKETDKLKLLQIFPEEVWELILNKVFEPEDLLKLCETSAYFKELLEPRKNSYLFSKVISILYANKYIDYSHSSGILRCRLVCASWRCAINQLLEKIPDFGGLSNGLSDICHNSENEIDIVCGTIFQLHRFDCGELNNEIIPEFEKHFYRNHCPFPSKYVEINEKNIRLNDEEYSLENRFRIHRNIAKRFLQLVGHHIWHAVINIRNFLQHRETEWYTVFRTYVALMPNLKSLNIQCPYKQNSSDQDDIQIDFATFPRLKYLNFLTLVKVPHFIMNQILHENEPNVLNIQERCISVEFPIHKIKYPEQVAISLRSAEELQKLRRDWTPKVLYLDFQQTKLSWATIFAKMELYRGSLVELRLKMPKAESEEEYQDVWKCSKILFDLPHVTRLEIGTTDICALDFLLGLKSLEELNLQFVNYDDKIVGEESTEEELQINFNDVGPYRFMECNIWELIPPLRKVRFGPDFDGDKLEYVRGNSKWSLI